MIGIFIIAIDVSKLYVVFNLQGRSTASTGRVVLEVGLPVVVMSQKERYMTWACVGDPPRANESKGEAVEKSDGVDE